LNPRIINARAWRWLRGSAIRPIGDQTSRECADSRCAKLEAYPSQKDAKLAAFDAMFDMKHAEPWHR
jgi:hypothetical protein